MAEKCEREVARMKGQVDERDLALQQQKVDFEKKLEEEKKVLKQAAALQLNHELTQFGKFYDSEKQDLYTELRVLKTEL